ncbi:MAG TPA: metal ABC transporter permease [Spirillospora sp.]|nr:metal ABC transporter permease [Spirillospora sp.]
MNLIERLLINLLLQFVSAEQLNAFLGDPQTAATIVGVLVAISGALLGTFLLLRKMSMTSDAISHTVLLGIVVTFLVMVALPGVEPDISSPFLIIGAALSGVATVVLTEAIHRSGLVKADAALGLAFPLLFAIAIILISRFTANVHLDTDAVILGEIGVVWADTESHCLDNCEDVVITADDPRAQMGRQCVNCQSEGISPRDPRAEFEEVCFNCGTYTAAQAWRERLIDEPPELVFWPRSITVMLVTTLLNLAFVLLLYKELKLTTFDAGLAAALGFRPGLINYALMVLVSVTAVAAFDAVGSVLVVAFFVIPAATAYLLTDRLAVMLVLSPLIGGLATATGYDFSRGNFLGLFQISDLLVLLDRTIGLDGYTTWNTSISASMALMMFVFFLLAWVFSPRYGLLSRALSRRVQRQQFADQMLLGHVYNHQHTASAEAELAVATLHEHLNWSPQKTERVLQRLRLRNLATVEDGVVRLTDRGEARVREFIAFALGDKTAAAQAQEGAAV